MGGLIEKEEENAKKIQINDTIRGIIEEKNGLKEKINYQKLKWSEEFRPKL